MKQVVIGIHQPNFFPWIGYFLKISKSDKFVFLDDVQFPKKGGSYINRTEIIIQNKKKWITVDIKRPQGVWNINKSQFAHFKWKKKVYNSILSNYAKAPFFKENKELLDSFFENEYTVLSDFNINFIKKTTEYLNIKTEFFKSSEILIEGTSDDRLINIIKAINGNIYISGKGGDNYQSKEKFTKNNISLKYNDFQYPDYKHFNSDKFYKGLSILDILFNIGKDELCKIIADLSKIKF